MKAEELRTMNDDQLNEVIRDAAKELFQLRFRAATEKQSAPSKIRDMRRRIARVKTIQGERVRQQAKATTA